MILEREDDEESLMGCFGSGGVGIEGANIPDRGGNFRSRKAPERQTGVQRSFAGKN